MANSLVSEIIVKCSVLSLSAFLDAAQANNQQSAPSAQGQRKGNPQQSGFVTAEWLGGGLGHDCQQGLRRGLEIGANWNGQGGFISAEVHSGGSRQAQYGRFERPTV